MLRRLLAMLGAKLSKLCFERSCAFKVLPAHAVCEPRLQLQSPGLDSLRFPQLQLQSCCAFKVLLLQTLRELRLQSLGLGVGFEGGVFTMLRRLLAMLGAKL